MDVFTKLFGEFLVFVYHCFDRIVIHGYLTALSRPELVVHFFRDIVGVAEVSKEVLSQRTNDYQRWVEAYARNHSIPIEWAEKGVRKEDHVLPWLHRMARRDAYGVYFIFKSMEQGPTYRVSLPKYPSKDPHYRILAHQRSRFTHYYFYIRDEVLGPMVLLVASFFPFRTAYYLNGHSFIEQELRRAGIGFRKHDTAFLAVADPAALQAAADRLSPDIVRRRLDYWTLVLGPKFLKKERAQLNLSRLYAISQVEYCRNFIFKRHFPIHKLFERARPVAARRRQDRCDLRHAAQSPHARQAGHGHRPDRARPSRLPRLLQERLPEAVREVLDLPAQRAGLKQPQQLRPEEGARPSQRRTHNLPGDHRPLRRLPGRMAQQPCRLSPPPAPRPPDHCRGRPLSRPQNP